MSIAILLFNRGDHFRFGSVFIKKSNQTEFFFWKKNRNRVKPTGFGSVLFFRGKNGSNRFGSVFFRFFIGFGSVRFFQFFVYKTEPAGFFKNLIGLIGFFSVRFFRLFFFRFSRFNRFIGFFAHPYKKPKKNNRKGNNKTMMWEICWNIEIIVGYQWNIINLNVRKYIKL